MSTIRIWRIFLENNSDITTGKVLLPYSRIPYMLATITYMLATVTYSTEVFPGSSEVGEEYRYTHSVSSVANRAYEYKLVALA